MVTDAQIVEAKRLLGAQRLLAWRHNGTFAFYGVDAWKAGKALRIAVTEEGGMATTRFAASELDAVRAELAEAGYASAVIQQV